ncbi:endonuclease/exonuclease/phosphatase family protein [Microbispora sp. NPDC049125]|uniref:endonuclease/exonuclease/phosphatase family protein n=1 Tax=Microbispora sp. NPDC049125 TaxID=3154929 RepID=UPI0034664B49
MTSAGTWNVENLFRPGGDFGPADQPSYDEKIRGIAETITRAGVDVLAVQEVGDPDALADVAGLLGGDWRTVTSAHFEPDHPIRVGFLSRLPFEVVDDVTEFPELLAVVQTADARPPVHQMGRGALAVRVEEASGRSLVMVACHLKSKLLSFPPGPGGRPRFNPRDEGERARVAAYALNRRTAEAVTVRALADRLLDGAGTERQVMVVGDLNDEPRAATTQILLGPPGSELDTRGADVPDKGDAMRLWNLAPRIPDAERFSRVYHGKPELIDHLLVSHALLRRAPLAHTIHPAGTLPSVTDDPTVRRGKPASDHALLYTSLLED